MFRTNVNFHESVTPVPAGWDPTALVRKAARFGELTDFAPRTASTDRLTPPLF